MTRPGDLDHRLRQMLDDVPPHDDRARRNALAAVATTTQRRFRWWPSLSMGGRRPGTPAQASLTAVAIVAVVLLLALGVRTQDGAPGSSAPDYTTPGLISGSIACGPGIRNPMVTYSNVELEETGRAIVERRGAAYQLSIVSMSDPRLAGTLTDLIDTDQYGAALDDLQVGALTWTLQNDDGSWTSQFVSFQTDPTDWSTATLLWNGSGDYEGLVAVTQLDYLPADTGNDCGWDLTGYIVESDLLPDTPEPMP